MAVTSLPLRLLSIPVDNVSDKLTSLITANTVELDSVIGESIQQWRLLIALLKCFNF